MANKPNSPRAWLNVAAGHLAAAKKLAYPPDAQLFTAVYHCQQAAEKATKALLIAFEIAPARTHDIGLLIGNFDPASSVLTDLRDVAERLTVFATEYRYPNASASGLDEQIVASAISHAEEFVSRAITVVSSCQFSYCSITNKRSVAR